MAKKGYHSLFKKSKSSSKGASKVKKAAKKASKTQAARAESTFKRQPKAQKQSDRTIFKQSIYLTQDEKKRRSKASGGTRQSQKRKQGDY